MKALITGITGFAGSHLSELLLKKGVEVHGICRPRSPLDHVRHIQYDIDLIEGDIRSGSNVERLVRGIRPDFIFHLAAQSFIPQSFKAPEETIDTNIRGTLHILEAVRNTGLEDCITQIAGSSEEYGAIQPDEVPVDETTPLRPRSQYAVSKVACDLLGQQYWHSHKVKTVITRAFNHTGPRRGEVFVTSNFAKQIAEIEAGKRQPVIMHGNLEAMRDFSDVRDIVKGYVMAAEMGVYGQVYNICSGRSIKIGEMLRMLLEYSDVEIVAQQDEARMRPSDINIFEGCADKFRIKTGWAPEIPFEKTLEDLLNYWRERV